MAASKFRRRALLGGGLAAAAVGIYEYRSLTMQQDHWRSPGALAPERFAKSRATPGDSIIHVGHSTHLISLGGLSFLTDPWFYDPAFGALWHKPAPAVMPEQLGPLDVVLISHDHPDHADFRAIDQMDKRALVVAATKELAASAKQRGFTQTVVLAAWEAAEHKGVKITATPAQHDGYEVGYVLEHGGKSIYFAGDTRPIPQFVEIRDRFKPVAAILPVDGTGYRGQERAVMNPDDAVEAAKVLGVSLALPSHAESRIVDPVALAALYDVDEAAAAFGKKMTASLPGVRCVVPLAGESVPF